MSPPLLGRLLRTPSSEKHGLATISLGLSVLVAVAAVVYFWWQGNAAFGLLVGVFVLVVGIWEYRMKATELHEEEKANAEAEAARRRQRE